jgi:hypothetical protein
MVEVLPFVAGLLIAALFAVVYVRAVSAWHRPHRAARRRDRRDAKIEQRVLAELRRTS